MTSIAAVAMAVVVKLAATSALNTTSTRVRSRVVRSGRAETTVETVVGLVGWGVLLINGMFLSVKGAGRLMRKQRASIGASRTRGEASVWPGHRVA